jgi:hypothetical protein
VRARNIHRLEKVDKHGVPRQTFEFALEPGRHLLEFISSSRDRVEGFPSPSYSVVCYIDAELDPGHAYELEGEFEHSSPSFSYDGLNWHFHQLDAHFVDVNEGKALDGLVCPSSCRAVGRGASRHSWMSCEKYLAAVAGTTPIEPERGDAPSVEDAGERITAECKRRDRERRRRNDAPPCVLQLMMLQVAARLGDGQVVLFVPRDPDVLLPDSRQKAIQQCKALDELASLATCLGDQGWMRLP